jgi:hypothetical protein
MEACVGCGALATAHPIVAVMKDPDSNTFIGRPCCKRCHEDPTHRTQPIKAHFFPAAQKAAAVAKAGSSSIGG